MIEPISGIKFGTFDSTKREMLLMDRVDNVPEEKEIKESIAFHQGEYDFSLIAGERFYQTRVITYTFWILKKSIEYRSLLARQIRNELLIQGITKLYDTYEKDYYYDNAKCRPPDIQDDHINNRLIINLTFEAKPHLVSVRYENHGYWDPVNLFTGVFLPKDYAITGTTTITAYNPGSARISPTVIASSPMTVDMSGVSYDFVAGATDNLSFLLNPGETTLKVTGEGTIEFRFRSEVL
ncbi:hypothetical protein [Listeria booriae]|uniref:hypothetical protein n=1 Tax=Listeria booriae TaxID=1552123 RepID=UPI001628CEE6|nr:hypothetical protein [Listeria booriae]MBC2149488.1 hypothetical protein [Listeria booriae]